MSKPNYEDSILEWIVSDPEPRMAQCVEGSLIPEMFTDSLARDFYTELLEQWLGGNIKCDSDIMFKVRKTQRGGAYPMSRLYSETTFISVYTKIDAFLPYIKDDYKLLNLERVGRKILEASKTGATEALGMTGGFISSLVDLSCESKPEPELPEVVEESIARAVGQVKLDGIPWPFLRHQELMDKPLTNEIVWLMGRRSTGKSALMLQWVQKIVQTIQGRVDIINLECGGATHNVTTRMMMHKLQHCCKRINPAEADICRDYIKSLHDYGLKLTSKPNTMEKIRAYCAHAAANGSKFIFIDNLKHIRPTKSYAGLTEQYSDMSTQFTQIRADTGIGICVLHHLTEDGKTKWATQIEDDADVIFKMRRVEEKCQEPTPMNGQQRMDFVEIDMEKNRDGITPLLPTHFYGHRMTFEEI